VLIRYLILLKKSSIILFFSGGGRIVFLLSVYGLTETFISGFHKIESLSNIFFSIAAFRDKSFFSLLHTVYDKEKFFLHEV